MIITNNNNYNNNNNDNNYSNNNYNKNSYNNYNYNNNSYNNYNYNNYQSIIVALFAIIINSYGTFYTLSELKITNYGACVFFLITTLFFPS